MIYAPFVEFFKEKMMATFVSEINGLEFNVDTNNQNKVLSTMGKYLNEPIVMQFVKKKKQQTVDADMAEDEAVEKVAKQEKNKKKAEVELE